MDEIRSDGGEFQYQPDRFHLRSEPEFFPRDTAGGDLEQEPEIEMTDDEKIDFVAARILKKYHKAFEELAK